MEMVEGTRIVELLLAMPPVESQTPIDSLREVPLLPLPFACGFTSSYVMRAFAYTHPAYGIFLPTYTWYHGG